MLNADVVPGRSLGPFVLGSPLPHVFDYLLENDRTIPTVKIDHDADWVVFTLPESSVVLRFDTHTQRLRFAEAHNMSSIKLQYQKQILCGPAVPPTLVHVYRLFGPTHLGEFNADRLEFSLRYNGVEVVFLIPERFRAFCIERRGQPPLELPDGSTPVMCRVVVHSVAGAQDPTPGPTNGYYREPVLLVPALGAYLGQRHVALPYGLSAGALVAALGPPDQVRHDTRPALLQLTQSTAALDRDAPPAVHYEYRTLGLDVILDGASLRVNRYHAYANAPGHVDFTCFCRCNFVVDTDTARHRALFAEPPLATYPPAPGAPAAAAGPPPDAGLAGGAGGTGTRSRSASGSGSGGGGGGGGGAGLPALSVSPRVIVPETDFASCTALLGPSEPPVVRDTSSQTNPFGPSLYYAYPHLILEVTGQGKLASVCIASGAQCGRAVDV